MNRILLILLLLVLALPASVWGEEAGRVLPTFEVLDMSDGLSDDEVFHILQLEDGRMVVTTRHCINLYDGKRFSQYPCTAHSVTKIPNYHGAYHVYADKENRLWVKEWGNVWCMDLDTGSFVDLQSMHPMTDVFIDSHRALWIVSDTTVRTPDGKCYHTKNDWGNLQDLDADDGCLFLFYSTGIVACFDRATCELLYTSRSQALAPYGGEDEAVCPYEDYESTSLVVRGADGMFYQLRGGKRYIFLCFNPETQEWRTVFETSSGAFHSLCVPTENLALIGCPMGVWSIGLQTGEMVLHSVLEVENGEKVHTNVNSVVCDKEGGLWLGTSLKGVLLADTVYAKPSYKLSIIVCGLSLLLLLVGVLFYRYVVRQRRKEVQLMQRIQELVANSDTVLPQSVEPMNVGETSGIEGDAVDVDEKEFLVRAIALVEQNLDTPGYTVERLASDLCMERTGLYRKLNVMVNQSPTLFMRSIRMKRAAQMLLEGNLSVQEIAERTGFSSASYFSRLFQAAYGCRPSEYGRSSNGHESLDEPPLGCG